MARQKTMKQRVERPVSFEYEELQKLEERVGKNNVSATIRELIKKWNEQEDEIEKNELGHNHIPIMSLTHMTDNVKSSNNNYETLDKYFNPQHINKLIKETEELSKLYKIRDSGKIMLNVAQTKINKVTQGKSVVIKR